MLLHIPNVLTAEEIHHARALLAAAPWGDGRASAGTQAAQAKNNEQLPGDCEAARELRALVLRGLDRHPVFFSFALPKRLYPPQFNRHGGATNAYGNHVDAAIRYQPETGERVRTDLSCTLFLSDPASHDGGELVMQDSQGARAFKLPAGDLLLYPGTHVHQVAPVTRGQRLACFFWIESLVRGGEQRRLLYDMDMALLALRRDHGESAATVTLTGTYHNLLRMWADT